MKNCILCDASLEGRGKNARYCVPCAEKSRYNSNVLARHKARDGGLCVNCFKPRGEDGTKIRCRACADATNVAAFLRREKLREKGRCLRCGKKSGGEKRCAPCKAFDAARKRRERECAK